MSTFFLYPYIWDIVFHKSTLLSVHGPFSKIITKSVNRLDIRNMRIKVAFAFFLGIALIGYPFSIYGQSNKKAAIKLAKEHLKFEEYEQAIPSLKELVAQEPGSAYYNYWLGRCLFETYRKNQSLEYLEKASLVNPGIDMEFHRWYALSLHYNLKFDEAIEEYKQELQRFEAESAEFIWIKNRISQCEYAKKMVERRDAKRVRINNLGPSINTPYSEHSPVISGNDSLLVFTARRPESLGADPKAYNFDEDVYISYSKGGEWIPSQNIGTPVNSKGHDATIAMTSKGDRIYIYRHKRDGGLYVTDFDTLGKKWKEPQPLGKPFNSKYYEACVFESADGSKQFFTSNRPGGQGGKDIYLVKQTEKGKWTEPENLGAVVNSYFDEDAPFLHAGGKILYFSSNGPKSMGGYDIFVSEFDSSKTTWLPPLNIGQPVNTPDDDIYFVMDNSGMKGYYSSGKEGGYGEKDIYEIEFPYFPYPRRYFIIELTGLVKDGKSMLEIPAKVVLKNKLTGEVIDSAFVGDDPKHFYFRLVPEGEYEIEVSADNYKGKREFLSSPKLEDDDVLIERTFILNKEEAPVVATAIDLMNVYFDFDKYLLRDESFDEIDRAISLLKANPELNVDLRGHTDWFGTFDYNVRLSENRSKSVYNYLVKNGIDKKRIKLSFFSENTPLETNENDEGRQFNRRTELHLYLNDQLALESKKLRKGIYSIKVDHAMPKGKPGFDNIEGLQLVSRPEMQEKGISQIANSQLKGTLEEQISSQPAGVSGNQNEKGGNLLKHIYFDFDKSNLKAASNLELEKVIELMRANPNYRLEIFGHTDWDGSTAYNQALSERRCKAARSFLEAKGISGKISLTGFSELQPIETNANAKGRQYNRRVEFRIYNGDNLVIQSIP